MRSLDVAFWLGGSVASLGIAFAIVEGGAELTLALIAGAALVVTAAIAPRYLSLWAIPVCVLVPPTVRIPVAGIPGLTPLRLLIFLAAVGWLVSGRQAGVSRRIPKWCAAFGVIFVFYVLLISLSGGASSISRGVDYSLEGLLVASCVWMSIRDRRDLLNLIDLVIGLMAVAAMLALYEVLTHKYLIAADEPFFFHAPDRLGGLRGQGIFPHPLVFGAAIALIFPLSIARVLTAKGIRRALVGASAGLFVVALIETGSRGPWGGAIVGVVVLAALLRGGRRGTVIAGVLACAVAIGFSPAGGKVATLARGVFDAQSGQEAGVYTVQYRQELLKATTEYVKGHPFGTGPGRADELHLFAVVDGHVANLAESIDNAFAKYALELGAVGLLLFLLLLWAITHVAWRARKVASWELSSLAAAILAGEVAFAATSFTVATYSWAQLAALFWVVVGASLVLEAVARADSSSGPAEISDGSHVSAYSAPVLIR